MYKNGLFATYACDFIVITKIINKNLKKAKKTKTNLFSLGNSVWMFHRNAEHDVPI